MGKQLAVMAVPTDPTDGVRYVRKVEVYSEEDFYMDLNDFPLPDDIKEDLVVYPMPSADPGTWVRFDWEPEYNKWIMGVI